MAGFRYVKISSEFLDHLATLLLRRESVVLLGPRHIGKRYVLARLCERLQRVKLVPVACARFLEARLGEPQIEACFISDGLEGATGTLRPEADDVLQWCDEFLVNPSGLATLLASNVDSMPFHRAREFLAGLRTRVEKKGPFRGSLAVVLTGEFDLRELVYGPNSEFNCAHQFVIQGFAEDQFEDFGSSCVNALGLTLDDPDHTFFRELWRRTGGSGYLLRLLFWAAFESWAIRRVPKPDRVRLSDIPDRILFSRAPWTYGPGYFRKMTRLVANSPSCWDRLRALKNRGIIEVHRSEPEHLELAGIAVRSESQLRFASPLRKPKFGGPIRTALRNQRSTDV